MRFISEAQHGLEEDQPGVHPDILQRYYGVDEASEADLEVEQEGLLGIDGDDEMSDWETEGSESESERGSDGTHRSSADSDLDEQIAAEQQEDIRHEGVSAPLQNSPFSSDEEVTFFIALNEIQDAGHVPEGYGVTLEEMDDGYPSHESVRVAARDVVLELPLNIWFPRAVHWVQAYDLMLHMLN
jgi:hypothetical protein